MADMASKEGTTLHSSSLDVPSRLPVMIGPAPPRPDPDVASQLQRPRIRAQIDNPVRFVAGSGLGSDGSSAKRRVAAVASSSLSRDTQAIDEARAMYESVLSMPPSAPTAHESSSAQADTDIDEAAAASQGIAPKKRPKLMMSMRHSLKQPHKSRRNHTRKLSIAEFSRRALKLADHGDVSALRQATQDCFGAFEHDEETRQLAVKTLTKAKDTYGWGLLQIAASSGQLAVVQWLLHIGLSPTQTGPYTVHAEDLAARNGHVNVAELLRNWTSARNESQAAQEPDQAQRTLLPTPGSQQHPIIINHGEEDESTKSVEPVHSQVKLTAPSSSPGPASSAPAFPILDHTVPQANAALQGPDDSTLSATAAPSMPAATTGGDSSHDGDTWYCATCRQTTRDDPQKHYTSIAHQFSCQHKTPISQFLLGAGNKGYQLMVKSGWDQESGLGANQQGKRLPVATAFKQDRLGLGAKPPKEKHPRWQSKQRSVESDSKDLDTMTGAANATEKSYAAKKRITHFQPFDARAVAEPPRKGSAAAIRPSRKGRAEEIDREKQFERSFRTMFDVELPQ